MDGIVTRAVRVQVESLAQSFKAATDKAAAERAAQRETNKVALVDPNQEHPICDCMDRAALTCARTCTRPTRHP